MRDATLPVVLIAGGLAMLGWNYGFIPDWNTLVAIALVVAGVAIVLLDGLTKKSLVAAMQKYFPATRPTLILGILRDKDCGRMCAILAPLARRILLSPVNSERSATPAELLAVCQQSNPEAEVTVCPSLDEALRLAANDSFTVIAGSLYLVGEAMELLRLAAAPSGDEKGLNEWSLKR